MSTTAVSGGGGGLRRAADTLRTAGLTDTKAAMVDCDRRLLEGLWEDGSTWWICPAYQVLTPWSPARSALCTHKLTHTREAQQLTHTHCDTEGAWLKPD